MIPLLLAALLQFTAADAEFAYTTTQEFVETCTPRDAGSVRGKAAANWILDHASAVGANVRKDTFQVSTPHGSRWMCNLEAEFPGNDPDARWVVLLSHYDTKPGISCPGANDGASTTALLISVARLFAYKHNRKGNLMLIWTDGEECVNEYGPKDGLWGAKRALSRLQASGKQIQSVICLDMLADQDLNISLPANADDRLRTIAVYAARKAGHPVVVKKVEDLVKDDHLPFLEAGIPSVLLIDFDYGPDNCYWHTPEDTIERLSQQSFLTSGQILLQLLNLLL